MPEFDVLAERLAARTTPLRVFFRDDDGGWSHARLANLVDDFVDYELALDIALIPATMDEPAVEAVKAMVSRAPERIHLHQHGYSHKNHERTGRACEFGPARDFETQLTDITRGQRRLLAAFGTRVEPIFTPPWNRCTHETVRALERVGIRFLSRVAGSAEFDLRSLSELPVTLDWQKRRAGRRLERTEFLDYALACIESGDTLGVMLHHEHMDAAERARLGAFVECLRRSGNVVFDSMLGMAKRLDRGRRSPLAGRESRHGMSCRD